MIRGVAMLLCLAHVALGQVVVSDSANFLAPSVVSTGYSPRLLANTLVGSNLVGRLDGDLVARAALASPALSVADASLITRADLVAPALAVAGPAVLGDLAVGVAAATGPLSEGQLYANAMPYDQFAIGYDADKGGHVERIDEPVQELPQINEVQAGQDQVFDKQFPDDVRQNRVDNKKEIHTYTTQQKVVTINNSNLYRYLKNLLVNVQHNTNVQRINHAKLNNLLITNLQETHQPKLIVQLSRTDTVAEMPTVNEAPIVENARKDNLLPPRVFPATVEKVGYDGQLLPLAPVVVRR